MKKKTLIWVLIIAGILLTTIGVVGILATRDTSTTTNPTPTMVPTTEPTTAPTVEPTTAPTEMLAPTETVTPTLVPTVPVTPTETVPTPTEKPEVTPTTAPTVAPTATSTPTPTTAPTSTPTPTEIPVLTPEPDAILATAPYGDNITGVLTGDGTFTLRGTGATYDYSKRWDMPHNSDKHDLTNYKSKVQKIVIEEGITEINGYALAFFRNCKEIVLPKSLVKIGECAFREAGMYGYWTDKKKSDVKDRDDQIYMKINLAESNVKEIAYQAFRDTTMEAIVLPETLEIIGENAFLNCQWNMWDGRNKNPIIIPSSVKQIDNAAFNTGWDYIVKGKSSWDDFDSVGYSDNPNYSDPESPYYSKPEPIQPYSYRKIIFEP